MCRLISWIEKDDEIYVVTDAEAFSSGGIKLQKKSQRPEDMLGHGFCRAYYHITGGTEREENDPWGRYNTLPDKIKRCVDNFQNCFGKMLSKQTTLNLNGATIPAELVIPNSVTTLDLGGATIPAELVIPDSVTTLDLRGATIPAELVIPDSVTKLYLYGATIPAELAIPRSVRVYK